MKLKLTVGLILTLLSLTSATVVSRGSKKDITTLKFKIKFGKGTAYHQGMIEDDFKPVKNKKSETLELEWNENEIKNGTTRDFYFYSWDKVHDEDEILHSMTCQAKPLEIQKKGKIWTYTLEPSDWGGGMWLHHDQVIRKEVRLQCWDIGDDIKTAMPVEDSGATYHQGGLPEDVESLKSDKEQVLELQWEKDQIGENKIGTDFYFYSWDTPKGEKDEKLNSMKCTATPFEIQKKGKVWTYTLDRDYSGDQLWLHNIQVQRKEVHLQCWDIDSDKTESPRIDSDRLPKKKHW
ncbi:uncharacterized protein L201_005471 [Kwoniella dendrophila CBS 6074]|uniref:Uncharacterized protein n=1 Tax=Kwoniella dendrophila CBS 6074 TaxID=1295534 RepID=A0AAX4JYR6_9TREE